MAVKALANPYWSKLCGKALYQENQEPAAEAETPEASEPKPRPKPVKEAKEKVQPFFGAEFKPP